MGNTEQAFYEATFSIQGMRSINDANRLKHFFYCDRRVIKVKLNYWSRAITLSTTELIPVDQLNFTLTVMDIKLLAKPNVKLDYFQIGHVQGWQVLCSFLFIVVMFMLSLSDYFILSMINHTSAFLSFPLIFFLATNFIQAIIAFPLYTHAFSEVKNRKLSINCGVIVVSIISCSYVQTAGLVVAFALLYHYIAIKTEDTKSENTAIKISSELNYKKTPLVFVATIVFLCFLIGVAIVFAMLVFDMRVHMTILLFYITMLSIVLYSFNLLRLLLRIKALRVLDRYGFSTQANQLLRHMAHTNEIIMNYSHVHKQKLRVSFFHSWSGQRLDTLKYVIALEQPLQHPISEAIRHYAKHQIRTVETVKFWQHYRDMGVGGYVDKRHIIVGNEQLISRYGYTLSKSARRIAQTRQARGETIIYVYEDGHLIAMIGFIETITERLLSVKQKLEAFEMNVNLIQVTNSKFDPLLNLWFSEHEQSKDVPLVCHIISDVSLYENEHSHKNSMFEAHHIEVTLTQLEVLPEVLYISKLTASNIKKYSVLLLLTTFLMLPLAFLFGLQPNSVAIFIFVLTMIHVLLASRSTHKLHLHATKTHV